ncbi:hypothetical protein FKP32DRAFT_1596494 [Trametes sanguinea]|nr:hypothetical protein FKP32DRAFT_1596494 [Trametes sanguinea]
MYERRRHWQNLRQQDEEHVEHVRETKYNVAKEVRAGKGVAWHCTRQRSSHSGILEQNKGVPRG